MRYEMKRLGIYYATACYKDTQGHYFTSPGLGKYLQVMNRMFNFEVVLIAPTTHYPLAHLSTPLPVERFKVYELPYFERFLQAMCIRGRLRNRLRMFLKQNSVDVIWLRYPAAYATELWTECKRQRTPCFYEAVADPVFQFENLKQGMWLMHKIALSIVRWHEREMREIAKTTPTFAVAQSLAHKLGSGGVDWIPASTVSEKDFYWRTDTCEGSPYRLLYVGGLIPLKSVETIIDAASLLQRSGVTLHLDILGDGAERKKLEARADAVLMPNTYRFHGYCACPIELDRFYRKADIFVMSSITEGFPRVILEAMARGVPVVATNIVGIPDLVHDGETGLLVPVRSPQALAAAVQRIIEDGDLRRRIIAGAYRVAEEHTVEKFLQRVVEFVRTRVGVDLTE